MAKLFRNSTFFGALAVLPGAAIAQSSDQAPATDIVSKTSDAQQQLAVPQTMTGEWGGLRSRLHDDGIDFAFGYTNEFAANVAGGRRHDATDVGQLALGATLDMEKLVGLRGGTLQTTITFRHGLDLDKEAGLGTLQQVQEVYGRGQTWRLSEFWYQQQLSKTTDLKVGRLTMSSDFGSFTCDFENLTFCGTPAGNLVGTYWYNSPVSQWGVRLREKHARWYAMAGVYESNHNNSDRNTFTISHTGAQGVTVPVEMGWTPRLGSRGLPGTYKVGAWYNSERADDVLLAADHRPIGLDDLTPLRRTGRYGGYFMLQQQLTGRFTDDPVSGPKATHGFSVFFNVTQTDRRTSRTDNQIAAVLVYIGAVPGRPDDDIGFAVGRTNVNGRAARAEGLVVPGSARQNSEYASELYYGVHVRPWLIVRPNLQYIVHPGGIEDAKNVVVLAAKSSITF